MTADNFILKKSGVEFSEVLKPKVTGTCNLDQATQDVDLEFFVLFSSVAGAMGNVGQADYAAANGFMDRFAVWRNQQVAIKQRYGRTCSINWGLWQAGGMRMDATARSCCNKPRESSPCKRITGMQSFYRSLALPNDQVLALEGEVTRLRRALFDWRTDIWRRPNPPGNSFGFAGEHVAGHIDVAEIDSSALVEKTQELLCADNFRSYCDYPENKIDPRAALEEYGIDSIMAMKLTSQLEKTFGALSKTLFFEYQTIHDRHRHIYAISFGPIRGTLCRQWPWPDERSGEKTRRNCCTPRRKALGRRSLAANAAPQIQQQVLIRSRSSV